MALSNNVHLHVLSYYTTQLHKLLLIILYSEQATSVSTLAYKFGESTVSNWQSMLFNLQLVLFFQVLNASFCHDASVNTACYLLMNYHTISIAFSAVKN